ILPADLGSASSRDPEARISNNAPPGNRYPVGETAVTWTAENNDGESESCDQLIRVVDCSKPALQLRITADKASIVQAGEEINYTLELCNHGQVPLENVTLWDRLPEGVDIVWVYPEPEDGGTW